MPDRSSDTLSPAEALFADWLAQRGRENAPDIESLCRDHPKEAPELRRLWVYWEGLGSILDKAGFVPGRSLNERIRDQYGPGVDPIVTLEARETAHPHSDALLRRLAENTLKASRYRLQGEIARGGMGAILKVFDEDLRRNLAMKVILGRAEPSTGETPPVDRRLLARFLEEAQVTGQLDHPGIVPVHELGLDSGGRVYFTMKLVKGRDLKTIFELVHSAQEGWNETRALGVLLKVCEAMAYAHAKGVIHRDLKPANVMVGSFGEVYVMDWGLARVLGRDDTHDLRLRVQGSALASVHTERRSERDEAHDSPIVTMDGDIVGTPAYMPPEQALGRLDQISARSDVYAIGAMLYHLLAGQMPYVPNNARLTKWTVLAAVTQGPPAPLTSLRTGLPGELVAIVTKAMERDPSRRYRDTEELADDLRAYLERRVVKAYQTGPIAELRKWMERNTALASAAAAGIVLLVAAAAVSLILKASSDRNAVRAREKEAESTLHAREAERQAEAARRSEQRAIESERLATQRSEEVLRLSQLFSLQELGELLDEAERLWPCGSRDVPRFQAWLGRARRLVDELPTHEEKLADLRARASPSPEGAAGGDAAGRDSRLNSQLVRLIEGIHTLADPDRGLMRPGISPEFGWGVQRRLEFAATIVERSLTGSEASRRWSEVVASVSDRAVCPTYAGLELLPQEGLLPIGRDPETGLWEFAHLQTGEPAERRPDGRLVIQDETGLVFVLLPGGTFRMGAQKEDPSGPNYDPHAGSEEGPSRIVQVEAFFLSKYEMTQGQWSRIAGRNPSRDRLGDDHPVEQVSWNASVEVLERLDLSLPDEAQWEYGARAGTTTVWWTGEAMESLRGSANLSDRSARETGANWQGFEDWLDDGSHLHANVGLYRANAFGLHDVAGNVSEWCRDARGSARVYRGGSFWTGAFDARSARSMHAPPEMTVSPLGLRPAKGIQR